MKIVFLVLFLCIASVRSVEAIDLLDHQRDVDIYRNNYATYEIKKQAYLSTPTYALEEELTTSAQTMLLSRADVWLSYWKLLEGRITELTQLIEEDRQALLGKLTHEVVFLTEHKQRLSSVFTRDELLQEAEVLNNQSSAYQSLAFLITSEIVTGKLIESSQALLDLSVSLEERVAQQQLHETVKTTKQRGIAVLTQRIQNMLSALIAKRLLLIDNAGYTSLESFSKISQELHPLFSELNQQLQTTIELSEGVEW